MGIVLRKNKKNTYALGILAAAVLSACSGGGGSGSSEGGGVANSY